jgi:hypothetical protein
VSTGSNSELFRVEESGNGTFEGSVKADTYFESSDTSAVLASQNNGSVFLRPNGIGSGTGAFSVAANGKATVSGELEATSLDINGNAVISGNLTVSSDTTYDGIQISGANIPTLSITDTTNNAKLVAYARNSDAHIGTESNHTLTIGTNNTTAITISNSQTASFAGDVAIAGDLTTEGDLIINNTSNVSIKDTIITLNSGITVTDNRDIGVMFERVGNNKFFGWDEDQSYFILAENTEDVSTAATTELTMGTLQTLRAKVSAETLKVGSGNIITINSILDQDNMYGDSATALATQQSIKAYADTKASLTGTQTIAGNKTFSGVTELDGCVVYSMSAGSLNTTGFDCAGLSSGSNGQSALFTFECGGSWGSSYQRIVYNCYNQNGTWKTTKCIDEGGNKFDVVASADGSTITFTFKGRSATQTFTPRVMVKAMGHGIVKTYT